MRCPACAKQLPEDTFYCAYCGALVHAAPAPFPRIALDWRAVGWALVGTAAGLPVSTVVWLLAGLLVPMPRTQSLTLGALIAALSGVASAALQAQVRWPLDAVPPRCSTRQLGLAYGIGGGLSVAMGAALVGAIVLPLGWGLAVPDLPSLLAGATSGLVGVAFALPPAALVGAVAGDALGQLGDRWPRLAAAWAPAGSAALAWWLSGSIGGGVVGAFVAGRANLALSTGTYLGANLQSTLQVLLFPLATYLVRLYFVFTN